MKTIIYIIFFLTIIFISNSYGDWSSFYPPDYITGSRQAGMGGIGYSFPIDENVLLFNPAGLGIRNERFKKLSASLGYVLDRHSHRIKQNHHLSLCSQPFDNYAGGFAFQTEYYYNVYSYEIHRDFQSNSQYILGFGGEIPFFKKTKHSLGVSLKYFRFYMDLYDSDISSNSFLVDFGYNGTFFNHIHTGVSLFNVPIIESYNSEERPLIPLKLTTSLGFLYPFIKKNDIDKFAAFFETYYSYLTQKEEHLFKRHIGGVGFELAFNETHFMRHGYRFEFNDGYDESSKFELRATDISFGLGLKIREHIEINFYHAIKSYNEDYSGVSPDRNHHIGMSINALSLFNE